MIVKSVSILFAFALSFSAMAASHDAKSARRDPNTSFEAYKMRAWFLSQEFQPLGSKSAVESAVSQDKAEKIPATSWDSLTELHDRFEKLRDTRFITTAEKPNFPRRSSWLYPDDGCFARAGLAIRNLSDWSVPVASKIFVFGNLDVKTSNSPDGHVTWWYHVAPIVEVAGQKYVLDPAINPKGPLKMRDWLERMGDPAKMEVAICGSGSYFPHDACLKDSDGIEQQATDDQPYYLDAEWDRIVELGRDPVKELGDLPPWL